jgi:hypothetical protein
LYCAVAPAGLLFSLAAAGLPVEAAAGLGAGATVVRGGEELGAVLHTARALLYHFVQSMVVALAEVVVFTAPADLPVDI